MKHRKTMSSELESRLNGLKPDDYMGVIILVKSNDDLGPLVKYLEDNNINPKKWEVGKTLNTISVNLQKKLIYGIAEQSYVRIIMEDQKIQGIKPPSS